MCCARRAQSPNVRFGDLAIEMGLMTRTHLTRLLMIQADRKRPVAEILVGQGVLSNEQKAREMASFRESMANRRGRSAVLSKIVPAPRGRVAAMRSCDVTAAV